MPSMMVPTGRTIAPRWPALHESAIDILRSGQGSITRRGGGPAVSIIGAGMGASLILQIF